MPETLKDKPSFSIADANVLATKIFGVSGELTALPSERDQNYLLSLESNIRYVFKITNSATPTQSIDFQEDVAGYLNAAEHGFSFPTSQAPAPNQEPWADNPGTGAKHRLRLVPYTPGNIWADYRPITPWLEEQLGTLLGKMASALQDYDHQGAHRDLQWDLQQAFSVVSADLGHVKNGPTHHLLSRILEDYQHETQAIHQNCRQSVIHGDANDYNLIIDDTDDAVRPALRLIDFGDAVHTATVNDLAIALAYALFTPGDRLATAGRITAAYHRQFELTEEELRILPNLIALRAATSITQAAKNSLENPSDDYLNVSVAPAMALIKYLDALPKGLLHYRLRRSCGLPSHPDSSAVQSALADELNPAPILSSPLSAAGVTVLDLGVGGSHLEDIPPLKQVGVGRYGEARGCYQTEQFTTTEGTRRTVHLGVDLFVPPGTPVHAPLQGTIHSVADNNAAQDYGPTVIIRHDLGHSRPPFFTLFGHLSRDSISSLTPGDRIAAGEAFCKIGEEYENGGWPPHLHLQVMVDLLGEEKNFPGVAAPEHRNLWLDLCPNPASLLGLPQSLVEVTALDEESLLSRRRQHLSPSLSLSYSKPLHIVRGQKQFLFDSSGRDFLDCVNNVCHVGHSHPHVSANIAEQAFRLNTNTRYIHTSILEYSERLTALFPDPLNVCFLVCSGSEANDLALRIARAATQSQQTLVLEGAYHGNLTSTVEISHYKFAGPGGFTPPDYVHVLPTPDTYRGQFRAPDPNVTKNYVAPLKGTLSRLSEEQRPLGVYMAESIMSCAGQIVFPENYLQEAYLAVRQAGGLCIADEVQVGFGRVGSHWWGFEKQGVVPDIVTLGKPIGNGHPLGAVITTQELADRFNNGMEYFNTYGGNPVSCAAGLAVLEVMHEESLRENAESVGRHFMTGLRELQQQFETVGDVRGHGLFLGIEFVTDRTTRSPAPDVAEYVVERMKSKRILLSTDGPQHNVIKIKPPLPFNRNDADRVVEELAIILQENPVEPLRSASIPSNV